MHNKAHPRERIKMGDEAVFNPKRNLKTGKIVYFKKEKW